jgi:hypothetical protein
MRYLFALLSLLPATPSLAQSDSTPRPTAPVCWRGKPFPICRAFWITEISGEYAFVSTTAHFRQDYGSGVATADAADVSSRLVWTVGPMFNRASGHAIGATLSAGIVERGSRVAIEARRRAWYSETESALDLSAGLVRMNVPFTDAAYGLTMGSYLGGGDLIHVTAHADLLLSGGRVRAGGTMGIGAGSYAAAGTTAALGLLAIALVAVLANVHWE